MLIERPRVAQGDAAFFVSTTHFYMHKDRPNCNNIIRGHLCSIKSITEDLQCLTLQSDRMRKQIWDKFTIGLC